MASRPNTIVTGRKAILTAMRALGDTAEPIAEEAVLVGTYTFRDEASRRAPRGDGKKRPAGTLKGRIKTSMKRKADYVSGHVVLPPESVFTEYGFTHVRSGKKIPAKPWARPAFDSKVTQVEKDALSFMALKLEAAAQRAGDPGA